MRHSKRVVAEQFIPTSTTPPSDLGIYRAGRKVLGVTGRIDMLDPETKIGSSVPQTIFQTGVPFVIFAGDGGSNGLSSSGTRGEFTLSAAVITNFWNLLAMGGYAYLPAGAGGLATGGWYWCKMTSDTAGEIFAETYQGTGKPSFVASPTPLPNLTAGRITQSTNEITLTTFTLPGGSMGPNGVLNFVTSVFGESSATSKTHRIRGGGVALAQFVTSTNSVADYLIHIRNRGTTSAQFGPRSTGVGSGGTSIGGAWQYTAVDTSADLAISVSLQISSNIGSTMLAGMFFSVQYGA